jgi:PBP1b-binding outer membrane lipoprotein LpoB
MTRQTVRFVCGLAAIACTATFAAGCHKKSAADPAPVENPTATADAQAAPAAAAPVAQPAQTLSTSAQASLADAQAAMKAKQYDRAADLMINLQKPAQALTPEQAAAIAAQMRGFQQDLASAVARGDPQAIAAAQRLRAASTPR